MKSSVAAWVLTGCLFIVIVISVFFTFSSVGRPFPGFLTYPNLVVSPLFLPGWLAPEQGVVYPWAVDSIDSTSLRTADDLEKAMDRANRGDVHIFSFSHGKEQMVKGLQIGTFRLVDFLGVCGPMFFSAVILLGSCSLIGLVRRWTSAAVSLFFLSLFLGGWMGTLPEWMVSHRISYVLLFSCSMSPACAMELFLFFPSPVTWVKRRPFLGILPLIVPGLTVFILFLAFQSSPQGYATVDTLNAVFIVLSVGALGVKLVGIATSSSNVQDRTVARLSLIGGLIPFVLVWIPLSVLIFFFHVSYGMFSFSTLLVCVPPAVMTWAYRRMSVPWFLDRDGTF